MLVVVVGAAGAADEGVVVGGAEVVAGADVAAAGGEVEVEGWLPHACSSRDRIRARHTLRTRSNFLSLFNLLSSFFLLIDLNRCSYYMLQSGQLQPTH